MSEQAASMLCTRCGQIVGTWHQRPECDAFYNAAFQSAAVRVGKRPAINRGVLPMTTPPLLATREALARGICDYHDADSGRDDDEAYPCWSCSAEADHLLASGVVRDPATLADDEDLVERVWRSADYEPGCEITVSVALRGLAAALTEGPNEGVEA